MSDVTQILQKIDSGDPSAAEQLLPLVYNELRRLAAQRMAGEQPGQTLQATALVHEAYLRLVGGATRQIYRDRRHFFATAATAMRRILVGNARAKRTHKRGGGRQREPTRYEGQAVGFVHQCRTGHPSRAYGRCLGRGGFE